MKCFTPQCGNKPKWKPFILAWAKGTKKKTMHSAARIDLEMHLCDECRRETRKDDLFSDESWDKLAKGFLGSGFAAPDKSTSELQFNFI